MNKDKYGLLYSNNPDGSVTVSIDRLKRYYPVPPSLPGTIEYQDVGKDMNLRREISKYYLEKTVEWIVKDNKLKKYSKLLKSKDGLEVIYNLLRVYVKNGKANWYDLRDPNNAPVIKEYLKYKLSTYDI
jgi:hypothetical protein